MKRKTVVVAYDDGAARPADIAVGLSEWAQCIFVAQPNAHTRMMEPLLAQFGPVLMAESADRVVRDMGAYSPDGLVTYSQRALGWASRLAAALDLPFHDWQVCELLTDKWEQRNALRISGVDTVQCYRVSHTSDWTGAVAATGLPAVLKPANGGGSRNTFLITDAAAGLELAKDLLATRRPGFALDGTLVLEEYLPGRDCCPFGDFVSVESVVCNGKVNDLAVVGKFPMLPPFRETGHIWPSPLAEYEITQVRELARQAVEALGVRSGATQTEIKLTPGGPRLIEVNGRLGGNINELSVRATGVNMIEIAARLAVGESIQVPPFYQGRPYFTMFHPAPRRPCMLLGIDGIYDLKRIPGVSMYRPYARAGNRLPGGVGLQEMDIVMGKAANFSELAAIVEKIQHCLGYRFSFADGDRSVTAARLGEL